jgi:hypothetical protein
VLLLGMAWRLNRYGHGDSTGPGES